MRCMLFFYTANFSIVKKLTSFFFNSEYQKSNNINLSIMKTSALLLIVLFCSLQMIAQNNLGQKGFAFQGIARGSDGSSITGKDISVIFKITGNGKFYEERHAIKTDAFGVFSAPIGVGSKQSSSTINFSELDFSSFDYNLEVKVDDNTIYNKTFDAVPYAKAAGNGVPIGTIAAFGGTTVPDGWLLCDGQDISNVKYAKLREVIGTAWGTNKAPDLRGVFLRGVNAGRTGDFNDPDAGSRVANNGGNTGDKVGSFQDDGYKKHNHSGNTGEGGLHSHEWWYRLSSDEDGNGNSSILWDDEIQQQDSPHVSTTLDGNHKHVINNDGGNETRPANTAVNYIIKY